MLATLPRLQVVKLDIVRDAEPSYLCLTVSHVKNRLQSAITKVCIVLGRSPVSLERLLSDRERKEVHHV